MKNHLVNYSNYNIVNHNAQFSFFIKEMTNNGRFTINIEKDKIELATLNSLFSVVSSWLIS